MINVAMDEQHIRNLIKKYTEEQPLFYWFMTKIKYSTTKQQQNVLNSIYDNVKHLLVKDRESLKTKEAFVIIFINFYRLYKISISYGKEKRKNSLIIPCSNKVYTGLNTCIPKVVRLLCDNGYIKKIDGGFSFDGNSKTSKYICDAGMKNLIQLYVKNKKCKKLFFEVTDMSGGNSNIRLKIKNEKGKKILNYDWKWNKQLRRWNEQLIKINDKLSNCSIEISDMDAFKQVYFDKNYEIFCKQYATEKRFWNKVVSEYRSKNKSDSNITDKEVCDVIIEETKQKYWKRCIKTYKKENPTHDLNNAEIIKTIIEHKLTTRYWQNVVQRFRDNNSLNDESDFDILHERINISRIKWKTINIFEENLRKKYERIAGMANLYMTLPNQNRRRLYRSFIQDFHSGGRHYHIWVQNVPESCQKLITIDKQSTVNIDICSCHFQLIANKHVNDSKNTVNISKDDENSWLNDKEDVYNLDIESLNMKVARKNTYEGNIKNKVIIRKKVKTIVNTLLNSRDNKQFIKSGKDNGHNESDLVLIKERLVQKFDYLEEYLCSGKGVQLQKEESDFIHNVMFESIVKNKLMIIPMCDGVICKSNEVVKVEEIFHKVWKSMKYTKDILIERKISK